MKKQNHIVRLANRFLFYLNRSPDRQVIMGDFIENYNKIKNQKGEIQAQLWYWGQIVCSLPSFIHNSLIWRFNMFKNDFKIALRNMKRHKIFAFINTSGLAIGIACTILILLWVEDELHYDRFHEHANNIYRVINYSTSYQSRGAGTPAPLAPAIKEEIPEIINYTRFAPTPRLVIRHDQHIFYEERLVLADPSIFELFTFPFVKGDPITALSSPGNIVITEDMAKKYFGNKNPIGKLLFIEGGDEGAKVSGVLKNLPINSHIQFDFIISFAALKEAKLMGMNWGDFNFNTYILLQPGAYDGTIDRKITDIAFRNNCPQVKWDNTKFLLQPFTQVHLDASTRPAGVEIVAELGDKRYVYIFLSVAFFILLIACINYMNLSTARYVKRAKEVGLKKVIGSNRSQLIIQFLGESLFYTISATCLAIIVVQTFLPAFNSLSGKSLTIHYLDPYFMTGIVLLILLTSLFAGSYPAFFLSTFHPANVLKGTTCLFSNRSSGTISDGSKRGSPLRKGLVVLQFSFSIGLIIATIVVYQQVNYIKNRNLGFNKENLIWVPVRENIGAKFETVKNKLVQHPNIVGITAKDWMQTRSQHNTTGYSWEGKKPDQDVKYISHVRVDYDYIPMMNIKMLAGRNFSRDFPSDDTEAFIVNEEAVKAMGIESPVGKKFRLYGKQGRIIGVMQDAFFSTLHHKINPQVFHLLSDVGEAWAYGAIFIKVKTNDRSTSPIPDVLSTIQSVWKKINPNSPFEYHFFDQTLASRYHTEMRTSTLFNSFAIVAIFISCLGLFGLASFTAEQRTKEIGIRKVLGASVLTIVNLLNKEYTKWIAIANIISWPIAWYAMNKWLQNFAYRINISWETFFLSGITALLIALLSIGFQSVRTALENPLKSLRYE